MSLTIRYIKVHKHHGLTLPIMVIRLSTLRFILTMTEIKIISPNANGFIPFPTHLVPVATPAGVPDPLTFLTAENNFNLETDKLIFVPPTGFSNTNFAELFATSNHNAAMAQLQPVAGLHGFGGGAPAAPAHAAAATNAAAPVKAAILAQAAVPARAMEQAHAVVLAQSMNSTRAPAPANESASSASSVSSASSAASVSLASRHCYATNCGGATRQIETRGR